MKNILQINLGLEEYVLPSVENCLRDNTGVFYSTQNAIRVHEWLGGSSTDPLVLEAVRPGPGGVDHKHLTLGREGVPAFAEKYHPGWLLTIEKNALAFEEIGKLLKENYDYFKEAPTTANSMAFMQTGTALSTKVAVIEAFNASNLFFGSLMPKRLMLETTNVLDILFTCVLTQRKRYKETNEEPSTVEYPDKMYNLLELDKSIGRLHQAPLEGFYPHPEEVARIDGFMDGDFFRECAMAFSAATGFPILTVYKKEKTKVFHWAYQALMSTKKAVPSMQVRPKPVMAPVIMSGTPRQDAQPSALHPHVMHETLPLVKLVKDTNVVSLFKKSDGKDESTT